MNKSYSFSAPVDLMDRLKQRVPGYGDRSKVIQLLIDMFLTNRVLVKVPGVPERKL